MPKAEKSKKPVTKAKSRKSKKASFSLGSVKAIFVHIWQDIKSFVKRIVGRERKYLSRRPHRSFRLTRKRDYKRGFIVPGYWSFTAYLLRTLWSNKKTMGLLVLVYVAILVVVGGVGSQETYSTLAQTLKNTGGDLLQGNIESVGQAGVLLTVSITSILSPDVTQAQTVLAGLAAFFGWLVTIWLLRNIMAGHKPKVRDGLYNGGSPILSTILIGFITTIQLIPVAFSLIVYSSADGAGMLEGGVTAMLVWGAVILLALISVYWLSSTVLALVVVALPGMYPMQAMRVAGDLVVGRRIRMILRYLWMVILVIVTWLVISIPFILFDAWFKQVVPKLDWLPIVPGVILTLSAVTLVFCSSYVYLLYRKVVDVETAKE